MKGRLKSIGTAKRIRVCVPFSEVGYAWDCRPFGFGRIVAPLTDGIIEIAPGVLLDLATGTCAESAAEYPSA